MKTERRPSSFSAGISASGPTPHGEAGRARRLTRRRFLARAAITSALWPAACRAGDGEIVVGVLAPFGTTPGEGIRNGARMAIDEIQRAGGIAGRKVRLVEADTAYRVERAVAGYQRLAGPERAVAVVGLAGNGVFAVMEQMREFRVPVLGTGVGADALTDMVARDPARYRWFFRVMHASSELAEVTTRFAVEFLHGSLGLERFAIMTENAKWTQAIADGWERAIRETPGMELAVRLGFSSATESFLPFFQRIREERADYILDATSKVEATTYLKQWAATHSPPIGAIPTGAGTKRYFDELGADGVSVASVATIPSEQNRLTPRSAGWWRAYTQRFGDPEYTSAYTYDAVHLLAEALANGGLAGGGALVDALERTHFAGVAGRWSFETGHRPRFGPGHRVIPILQYYEPRIHGYRIVWPPERAQGPFVLPRWWKR